MNPLTPSHPLRFAHAVVAARGWIVHLGGQTAQRPDGAVAGGSLIEQFDLALANVAEALREAGARPEHLVSMLVCTTDVAGYRVNSAALGSLYRRHLGRHCPAVTVLGVAELFDPAAKVELLGTAVIPSNG
ncbi:MAG: RidA family protein [Nocardiopsaceae bacterium]|nr:RidA family protein [Nocardiopsaceae bacterium]